MSVKGVIKDLLYLYVMVALIVVSILTLILYFTSYDESVLYGGLILIGLIVFAAIAKYRFWVDTIMTLVRKWR